jgi:hypothetical protein
MNVFDTHAKIVADYASYIGSFINIADPAIKKKVDSALSEGTLWPDPLLQFNPAYQQAGSVNEIAKTGLIHPATYIPMHGGFLYLVAVMDWFSRFVLSWDSIGSAHITADAPRSEHASASLM